MEKIFQNSTKSAIPVYADSARSQQIGKLYAKSSCACISEQDAHMIILYRTGVGASNTYKVGFVAAPERGPDPVSASLPS